MTKQDQRRDRGNRGTFSNKSEWKEPKRKKPKKRVRSPDYKEKDRERKA